MRVSDLLNEVSAAQEFTVGGQQFKARVNVNKAPSKDVRGSWDLVLVGRDGTSITAPEFFSYKNIGDDLDPVWMLQTPFNAPSRTSLGDGRDSQVKPFPGASVEKDFIEKFCNLLTKKDKKAKSYIDLEDPENKLGLK